MVSRILPTFTLGVLFCVFLVLPCPPVYCQATEGAQLIVAPSVEKDDEVPAWIIRSCCEMPSSLLRGDEGLSLAQTVALLCVESALRTVDEAMVIQRRILEGEDSRSGVGPVALRQVETDLGKAARSLSEQKRLLVGTSVGMIRSLVKNVRDTDRLVRMDLSVQRKIRKVDRARNRGALLKRLDLVGLHLDRALIDYRRIVAGGYTDAR